ncbi:MAG: 30S ribosomal protein S2 [Candidatus Parcubacteria bacterium]|nr:MAG: 30S ribosomal protein S2 [Candidatus Parcubacteria bacterium]
MTNNQENNNKQENKKYKDFLENGCHYGRAKRFTHPSMKKYLLRSKNSNIEFFNLKKTVEKLNEVANSIKKIITENKIILFVGTKPSSEKAIKDIAQKFNMPYINYKWTGGLLTNFETIYKRLTYFKELLKKEETKELEELPTYERQKIKKELEKMKKIYYGLLNLNSLPDYIFIVDLNFKNHKTAYREAIKKNIPIIALAGSDNDISKIFSFIPANDKAPKSINFIISSLINLIKK